MKELAMDIVKQNNRGILAKAEIEKMFGCKLDDMTDEQKTLGLACLIYFEKQWNIGFCDGCEYKNNRHQKCSCCKRNRYIKDCYKEKR